MLFRSVSELEAEVTALKTQLAELKTILVDILTTGIVTYVPNHLSN